MSRAHAARPLRYAPMDRLLALVAEVTRKTDERRTLLTRLLLRAAVPALLSRASLPVPAEARLFTRSPRECDLEQRIADEGLLTTLGEAANDLTEQAGVAPMSDVAHALGALFELIESLELVGDAESALRPTRRRKRTGTFYTPAALAAEVAVQALAELERLDRDLGGVRICDPACGAGAFLIEAARALLAHQRSDTGSDFDEPSARRASVRALYGVDLNPLALDVAELALWVFAGDASWPVRHVREQLFAGDALTARGPQRAGLPAQSLDWRAVLAHARATSFDLVIGNPPWVAYAGRAAQPLSPALRAFYAEHYPSFHGYPTLHAMFVDRALELAPRGVVALLVPSPIADIDGYRPVRRRVLETHAPCEPLLEFGQNAFASVVQPCFALIACPRDAVSERAPIDQFRLAERSVVELDARAIAPPRALSRLEACPRLPPDLFGEMGLQTTRVVTEKLLFRGAPAAPGYVYPLLEGRDVHEFRVGPPRLHLRPDPEILRGARCRVRSREAYENVRFVVRQTARAPIAALHSGLPFRNSLLGGFAVPDYPPELVVGLLNSTLYRALHLARQRDGRQRAFPQVKIAHLRALPTPPRDEPRWSAIIDLTRRASAGAPSASWREALDRSIFELFRIEPGEASEIGAFLRERAPELARNEGGDGVHAP